MKKVTIYETTKESYDFIEKESKKDMELGCLFISILEELDPEGKDKCEKLISGDIINKILDNEIVKKLVIKNLKNDLNILCIDSGFNSNINSKTITSRNIVINTCARNGYSSITTFLHELGHIFHYSLTNDLKVIPEKFNDLCKVINMGNSDHNEFYKKASNISGYKVIQEKFADYFMVAIIRAMQIDVKEYNCVFNLFSSIQKDIIAKYFNDIIEIDE